MGWPLLGRRRLLAILLSRGETVSKDLVALDGAIEFLLLAKQHVAQFLHAALKVRESNFKIIEASGFGHFRPSCAYGLSPLESAGQRRDRFELILRQQVTAVPAILTAQGRASIRKRRGFVRA
jgi:hypothetical protein